MKNKYKHDSNIHVLDKQINEIDTKFNTIVHFNVLEHIKEDKEEILNCLKNINKNGYLIILVPAHNKLYSKLDKAVGHYRRYDKSFFYNLNLQDAEVLKLKYLDCFGYILYYLNKLVFKDEVYPSKLKIFIWDKIFTPLTIIFDFFTFYRFGKNVLCVIKKIK